MLIVDGKLVSDDVVAEEFVCNLSACRGACCHQGDYGAPLEPGERAVLEEIYPSVRPYLTEAGRRSIEEQGLYEFSAETEGYGVTCVEGGACTFMLTTPEGFAACGMEVAFRAGATDFKKPISCELYPIRVEQDESGDFEALNYDRWDICSPACTLGAERKVPVYRFVKEAIVRKWGLEFYEELDAAARHLAATSR